MEYTVLERVPRSILTPKSPAQIFVKCDEDLFSIGYTRDNGVIALFFIAWSKLVLFITLL